MAISINGAEQLDIHRQKMDPDISLMPHAKSNSKWIRDLRVKYKTVKFLGIK